VAPAYKDLLDRLEPRDFLVHLEFKDFLDKVVRLGLLGRLVRLGLKDLLDPRDRTLWASRRLSVSLQQRG
jgi:hypothetical protein